MHRNVALIEISWHGGYPDYGRADRKGKLTLLANFCFELRLTLYDLQILLQNQYFFLTQDCGAQTACLAATETLGAPLFSSK